jgi:hypothetical protein
MTTITEQQYRVGQAIARHFRSARLDTQTGSPPPPIPQFE